MQLAADLARHAVLLKYSSMAVFQTDTEPNKLYICRYGTNVTVHI